MTLPAWPSGLPCPKRAGHQSQFDDPRLKKAADTGPPGYRRRWSSVARNVALAIEVTRAEKAIFDTFHQVTTQMGALPFTMADPTTDGWALLDNVGNPVLDGNDTPILLAAQWLCLFGEEMPLETFDVGLFQLSFSVWVLP